MFLWVIIVLCFSVFVIFIVVLIYYKIRYINLININGVIFFKINLEKNNVIRLSSDNFSGLVSFDDDKIGIKKN